MFAPKAGMGRFDRAGIAQVITVARKGFSWRSQQSSS
jgi:hypothetical protein